MQVGARALLQRERRVERLGQLGLLLRRATQWCTEHADVVERGQLVGRAAGAGILQVAVQLCRFQAQRTARRVGVATHALAAAR